jgi:hypothetical protein
VKSHENLPVVVGSASSSTPVAYPMG